MHNLKFILLLICQVCFTATTFKKMQALPLLMSLQRFAGWGSVCVSFCGAGGVCAWGFLLLVVVFGFKSFSSPIEKPFGRAVSWELRWLGRRAGLCAAGRS